LRPPSRLAGKLIRPSLALRHVTAVIGHETAADGSQNGAMPH
jgi:hypothetical protein